MSAIRGEPRSYSKCAKCCEGWLHGSAFEKKFWRERLCHYLAAGKCSIYGQHPEVPCKVFRCEWLANDDVPGWLRPDKVNSILVKRRKNGIGSPEFLSMAW